MSEAARRRDYLRRIGVTVWRGRGPAQRDAEPAPGTESSPRCTAPPALAAPVSAGPSHGLDVALAERDAALRALEDEVAACTRCKLHATRNRTVFGVGRAGARCMVIGEAPGAEEDRQGEPFVGRAGQLLDAMLAAIGVSRDSVYIANIVKCRPPRNRDPEADEAAACAQYLRAQIERVGPVFILAMGRVAAQTLLATTAPVGRLRGRVHTLPAQGDLPLLVTYHPAYLLRSPQQKGKSWQDLKAARALLES